MKDDRLIITRHQQCLGGDKTITLKTITDKYDGESEVLVSYEITKRMSLNNKNWEKMNEVFEDLKSNGFVIDIEDLVELRKKGKVKK